MKESVNAPAGGLSAVLGATAFAGIVGYAIQLLSVSALPDAERYLSFSVFWSTMYLFGGAVGGVQQELARATHPVTGVLESRNPAARFAILAAAVVGVAAALVAIPLAPVAFSAAPVALSAAFVLGMVGYVLTSTLTGILYGIGQLKVVAALIVSDAALRSVAVLGGLLVGASAEFLAFAITIPFGASVVLVWLICRRRVVGRFELDLPDAAIARNALRTVGASSAIGVMVAGLPLLFGVFLGDAPVVVASLVMVVTITRAPLIIPLMALQTYLIVFFRDAGSLRTRRLIQVLSGVAAVSVVCVAFGAWLVPGLIDLLSSGRYQVDHLTSACVITSAALVGLMCVTSAALLAANRHNAYFMGWLVAAVLTIGFLALGTIDVAPRALLSLVAAPLIGLTIQLVLIARLRPPQENRS